VRRSVGSEPFRYMGSGTTELVPQTTAAYARPDLTQTRAFVEGSFATHTPGKRQMAKPNVGEI
jgi:hypothetical protein